MGGIAFDGDLDRPRKLRLTLLCNAGMAALYIGAGGPGTGRVGRAGRTDEDVGAVNSMLLNEMLDGCLSIAKKGRPALDVPGLESASVDKTS